MRNLNYFLYMSFNSMSCTSSKCLDIFDLTKCLIISHLTKKLTIT